MDKPEVVRCLRLANDLWAIEGANPFSIRAHERSAAAIWDSPLDLEAILALPPSSIPGVGKETLAMVRALQAGGLPALLDRLQITIPLSAAELLHLPGIGPKTAHQLVHQLGIDSVGALAREFAAGRVQQISGLGPAKLARLKRDLEVMLERQHSIPIALATPVAEEVVAALQGMPGVQQAVATGALRRGVVSIPVIEVLVASDDASRVRQWAKDHCQHSRDTADERDDRLHIQVQTAAEAVPVTITVTSVEQFPGVLFRSTGDDTHQQVIDEMLHEQGISWTADGRLQPTDNTAGASKRGMPTSVQDEGDIYALVGLPWLPPELREDKGMLQDPSQLVEPSDIRGDLHVHSTWSDGSQSIREVAAKAESLGYEYIAITDHSQSLTIANGLTPERVALQQQEIAQVQTETPVRLLCGTEVDILADGRLDLPDDTLYSLDLVVASVHGAMQQSAQQMTERILSAIEHPAVHIIGHLTGRIIGRRAGYEVDVEAILQAAVRHGVMLELNANPNRLDISEVWLRRAQALGLLVPIDTDAHHQREFAHMAYGVRMARRGWLRRETVFNARPLAELLPKLQKQNRH
ncbi:PHP domain-containing protein [Alicyclobacillus sp. ALC3]|uniref:PHP domain-containing protein n=1 Tax=Alicyclobacillus sp. ALC3 TaxID=2796143 RepID=UPI002377E628|nr:PHP domain-containing protein [Alicyclobacillus sp. ALC3]WDL98292.1 PHP domain-containing protein [Alicyclobacillus sp. ALC3]